MYRAVLTAIMAAFCASYAVAQEPLDAGLAARLSAASVEWTMANCGVQGVPDRAVAVAQMIINGSTPEQMSEARRKLQDAASAAGREIADLCAETLAQYQKGASP